MSVNIRRLQTNEANVLQQLNRVFAEAFEDTETYCQPPPGNTYLTHLLSKKDFIALIAEQEGQVIGGLTAYQLVKYEKERSEIYIYDLAVLSQYRRQGIATALINALKPIADTLHAHTIYVQADVEDKPALQLYQKLGRMAEVRHVDIPISE